MISKIEQEITNTLKTVDGTLQSTGYTFYTNTGQVQIYNEALALAINNTTVGESDKSVNHTYEFDESTGIQAIEISIGQKAYSNQAMYTIRSKVHNLPDDTITARNEIRVKMNECLNDLLFAFGQNYHLNNTVQSLVFLNSSREYEDITNNRVQAATLISKWVVTFHQSFDNPNNSACW